MKKPTEKPKKIGRPSKYSSAIAEEICTKIAEGESLRSICKKPGMPGRRTVFSWLEEKADFQHQYAQAMDHRADAIFDEILDICDEVEAESAHVAKARLRIDTRKWVLSRMAPKKYSDSIKNRPENEFEHMTDEELEHRIQTFNESLKAH